MSEANLPHRIGKYEILSVLGRGGMGVVYRGRDPLIDRPVAIKTIADIEADESLVARLQMEARSAGRLHHPNIVTIYDFGQQDELWYLAMEMVEGANLARVIQEPDRISIADRLDIVIKLCDALAYAHGLGVIHRDIKPANICLTTHGDPKILDFGLARFDETRLTRSGMTSGTLAYMSPERIRGENSPADDVFAIGAVAYELFAGRPAYPGTAYGDIVTKILSPDYPLAPSTVSGCPPELDALILAPMRGSRTERVSSAQDLAARYREMRHSPVVEMLHARGGPATPLVIRGTSENPYSAPEVQARNSGSSAAIDPYAPTSAHPHTGPAPLDASAAPTAAHASAPHPRSSPPADLTEAMNVPSGERMAPTLIVPREEQLPPTVVAPRPERMEPTVVARSPHPDTVRAARDEAATTAADPNAKPRSRASTTVATFSLLIAAMTALLFAAVLLLDGTTSTALIAYLAATAVWVWMSTRSSPLSEAGLLAVAAGMRAPMLLLPVAAAGWRDGEPLLTKVLLSFGAEGMSQMLMLRAGIILIELAAVVVCHRWRSGERTALLFATCPALVLLGAGLGRPEVLAASLMIFSMAALYTKREKGSMVAGIAAASAVLPALIALPVLFMGSWHLFAVLAIMIAGLALPVLLVGAGDAWLSPLQSFINESPLLAPLHSSLAGYLADNGLVARTDSLLALISERMQRADPYTASAEGLASILIVLGLLVAGALIAKRFDDLASALSAALALVLIVSVTPSAAAWTVLAATAIVSRRAGWIALAVSAPLLLWDGSSPMATVAVMCVIAAAVAVWSRGQRQSAPRATSPIPS